MPLRGLKVEPTLVGQGATPSLQFSSFFFYAFLNALFLFFSFLFFIL